MIRLQPFSEHDFDQLIAEIPDARFLLQWAGPDYSYPLDRVQLAHTLAKTYGAQPSHCMFNAIRENTSQIVGHIQLMNIDYRLSICILGRVLIYEKNRRCGLGKEMVASAVAYAFHQLGLREVRLSVFDFNSNALNTYKRLGFVEYQFCDGARQFGNECWNLIRMKLRKNK